MTGLTISLRKSSERVMEPSRASALERRWPAPHLEDVYRSWTKLQELRSRGDFVIDGSSLDVSTVVALARHGCLPSIDTSEKVKRDIDESVETLKRYLKNGYSLYGVNTGFGGSADTRTKDMYGLQRALMQHTQSGILTRIDIQSGSSGSDDLGAHAMPTSWTRASMIVRANTNIRGHSALSRPVVDSIVRLLCENITPIVPMRGSISASGDLMPLSYVAGAIQGNPDIYVRIASADGFTKITTAQQALKTASIQPIVLGPKEGLSLINGTATSAAIASLAQFEAQQLSVLTQLLTALTSDALAANAEWAHPFIQQVRPHSGQIESAQNIRAFLKGSKLSYGLEEVKDRFSSGLAQERYALRSSPQWLSPLLEDMAAATRQLNVELNSTSDNPVVNVAGNDIHCGANFQAAAVTMATEKTRSCLQMLGKLLFSQASEMINHDLSNGLPSNLAADDPSLSFCLKGIDVNMAAYQSELAFLANPVSSHVQSAEMHNQAINSLALLSARYTLQAVELLSLMCAACLYTGCQAVDLRVMHKTFLQAYRNEGFSQVLRPLVGEQQAVEGAEKVLQKVWKEVEKVWYDTAALDAHERCAKAADAVVGCLVRLEGGRSKFSVDELRKAGTSIETGMLKEYIAHRERFFQSPSTEGFLGKGTGAIYQFVRKSLGVPMHRGLIEHPVAGEEASIDGRPKKTIGSWVSVIYEAIRDGRLHDQVMRIVEWSGLVGQQNGIDRN